MKDDDVEVRSIKFTPDKDLIDRFRSVYLEREVDDAHHSAKLDEEEVQQKLAEFSRPILSCNAATLNGSRVSTSRRLRG